MATVREVSPGRWELRVYLGKDPLTRKPRQPSRTVDATGKRDAQRQAMGWEVELRGERRDGEAHRFGEALDRLFKRNEKRWSPSTVKEHRGIRRRYLTALEDVDLDDLQAEGLDDFYLGLGDHGGACQRRPCRVACPEHGARCRRVTCERPVCREHRGRCAGWVPCEDRPCSHGRPLDQATVIRTHVLIHSALELAVKYRWVKRNAADHAEPGSADADEVEPPESAAIVSILAEAEKEDFRLAVFLLVAADTAARRGANCAIRRDRINLTAGTLAMPMVLVIGENGVEERKASKKKKAARAVALNPYAVAAVGALIEQMEERARVADAVLPHDCFIFSDDVLGQVPWRPDSTSRKVRRLLDRMGLHDLNLKALRHAMATLLLNAGVAPQVVAKRGGWSNVATMLNNYAHRIQASDREAAAAIGALLAPDRLPR